jgi:hypothetical protein
MKQRKGPDLDLVVFVAIRPDRTVRLSTVSISGEACWAVLRRGFALRAGWTDDDAGRALQELGYRVVRCRLTAAPLPNADELLDAEERAN